MKKIIYTLAILSMAFSVIATPVYAIHTGSSDPDDLQDICKETGFSDPILCGYKIEKINEEDELKFSVGYVLNAIYGVIGIIAVVMIVIAGIKYSTSQGDPGKVQSAKQTIMYAIIGLIIVISAFAITNFLLAALAQ